MKRLGVRGRGTQLGEQAHVLKPCADLFAERLQQLGVRRGALTVDTVQHQRAELTPAAAER